MWTSKRTASVTTRSEFGDIRANLTDDRMALARTADPAGQDWRWQADSDHA